MLLRPNDLASNMTIRECFAMHALQGLLAAPDTTDWPFADFAQEAVRNADALIAQLSGATATPSRIAEAKVPGGNGA